MSSDQAIAVLDRATREFATVFVDLPANWTNWSLSLIARADKILLVTELSVAALNRARRQLDLLAEQDLGRVPLQLIVNRNVRKLLGGGSPVKFTDVEQALGRTVDFSIADDPEVLAAAIERGVPIDTIRRKSAIGKDLDTISTALAADFGLER
jgi:pilus assembly protein CpaE